MEASTIGRPPLAGVPDPDEGEPLEGETADEQPGPDVPNPLEIEGANGQITLQIGGRKPDESLAKMKSVSIPVDGEFKKGDVVNLLVRAQCVEVGARDALKEGEIVSTGRRQVFVPLNIEVVPGK